jgi:spore maturation protein CgeB
VSDEEYVRLYSASRISLGFSIVGDTHRTLRPQRQVRLREFEGPMSGAFCLTGFMEELGYHYEIGREIVCYRSAAELVDLARHYLAHDTERERIRRAGHARALRDHTWHRRFQALFADLRARGVLTRD